MGRTRWYQLAIAAAIATGLIVALLAADRIAAAQALAAVERRAHTAAILLGSSFRRELEKFRLVTVVLADDREAREALLTRDPGRLETLNRKLEALSRQTRAANVYLLDSRGRTVAASNWRRPDSFLGDDYAFRGYFRDAMRRGEAQQFALGQRSRRPGLYMTDTVTERGRPIGVFVVKVEFGALEAEWRDAATAAFVTDRPGIILVSTDPAWRFTTTRPLSAAERARARRSLEYGAVPLTLNPLYATRQVAPAGSGRRAAFAEAVEPLAGGWRVHVLAPTAAAVASAVTFARLALAILVAAGGGLYLFWRYRRRAAAARADRAANARTAVLRDKLVQANKLATLGQITAGVGHEINQPVAAIAAYAHNARAFLDRDRPAEAADALDRITALTQRIGVITRELRGFARRASGATDAVAVEEAIEGVRLLLRDRLNRLEAALVVEAPPGPIAVRAERVRLEQVLVNLVQNALDAGARTIRLTVRPAGPQVEIAIADDGPGLSPEIRAGLFQPFTTGKADGLGLGLVICRDIVSDFRGTLDARDPPHGAEFVLTLGVPQ